MDLKIAVPGVAVERSFVQSIGEVPADGDAPPVPRTITWRYMVRPVTRAERSKIAGKLGIASLAEAATRDQPHGRELLTAIAKYALDSVLEATIRPGEKLMAINGMPATMALKDQVIRERSLEIIEPLALDVGEEAQAAAYEVEEQQGNSSAAPA